MTKYENLTPEKRGAKVNRRGYRFEDIIQDIHELDNAIVERPNKAQGYRIRVVDLSGTYYLSKQLDFHSLFDGYSLFKGHSIFWQCKHTESGITQGKIQTLLQNLAHFAANYAPPNCSVKLFYFHSLAENKTEVPLRIYTVLPDRIDVGDVMIDLNEITRRHKEKFQSYKRLWKEPTVALPTPTRWSKHIACPSCRTTIHQTGHYVRRYQPDGQIVPEYACDTCGYRGGSYFKDKFTPDGTQIESPTQQPTIETNK